MRQKNTNADALSHVASVGECVVSPTIAWDWNYRMRYSNYSMKEWVEVQKKHSHTYRSGSTGLTTMQISLTGTIHALSLPPTH